jgi:hypothetical protein
MIILAAAWLSLLAPVQSTSAPADLFAPSVREGLHAPETKFRHVGWPSDTLFYAPHPLRSVLPDSFGYRGNDRSLTRYAVSDAKGEVRFADLPRELPLVVEVLVPTANFAERGSRWRLGRLAADGSIKVLEVRELALHDKDLAHGSHLEFVVIPAD